MLFEKEEQQMVLNATPTTIGHEATGWVVQLGSDVAKHTNEFKEGDAVGFIPAMECCYTCVQCQDV